ncbi:MAG: hypothetical protein H6739_12425 [Alphaproteobacteria bacterium]|nr:hypothetical protein [Alphaproteobacteria bacterium]
MIFHHLVFIGILVAWAGDEASLLEEEAAGEEPLPPAAPPQLRIARQFDEAVARARDGDPTGALYARVVAIRSDADVQCGWARPEHMQHWHHVPAGESLSMRVGASQATYAWLYRERGENAAPELVSRDGGLLLQPGEDGCMTLRAERTPSCGEDERWLLAFSRTAEPPLVARARIRGGSVAGPDALPYTYAELSYVNAAVWRLPACGEEE